MPLTIAQRIRRLGKPTVKPGDIYHTTKFDSLLSKAAQLFLPTLTRELRRRSGPLPRLADAQRFLRQKVTRHRISARAGPSADGAQLAGTTLALQSLGIAEIPEHGMVPMEFQGMTMRVERAEFPEGAPGHKVPTKCRFLLDSRPLPA